jgi:hypothetical protein
MVETALSSVKGVVVARVSLRKHAAIVLVDTRLRYRPPSSLGVAQQVGVTWHKKLIS